MTPALTDCSDQCTGYWCKVEGGTVGLILTGLASAVHGRHQSQGIEDTCLQVQEIEMALLYWCEEPAILSSGKTKETMGHGQVQDKVRDGKLELLT